MQNLRVFNPCLSDHEAIIFNVMLNKPKPITKTIKYWPISKIDPAIFIKDVRDSSLTSVTSPDPVALVNTYNYELMRLLDVHALL